MAKTNHADSETYRSLTRNMILTVVLVSFTPLIFTLIVIVSHVSDAYRQKVIQHMGELAQKHAQNIDNFLHDRLGDLAVMARTYSLDELKNADFLERRLRLLQEEYKGGFVDLGLLDSTGVQVAYSGPFHLNGADYSQDEWYQKARPTEYFISDVFTGRRGSPHFIVAVRRSLDGRQWTLRATIDFMAFNSLVENIRLGQTGFAFIANRQGRLQTSTRTAMIGPAGLEVAKTLTGDPIKVATWTDDQKQEWLAALVPIKGGQWVLGVQQELSEAMAVPGQTQKLALATLLLGGLGIVVMAVLLSRRMVRRISTANQEKALMTEKVMETGRLAAIGELAAGVAHEINNPVAIMVEEAGWIDDLVKDGDFYRPEGQDELRRAVKQIKTQGGRCKEITHKLLSFARRTDGLVGRVDLNQVVRDTVSLLRQKTRYAHIRLETDLDPDLPSVSSSPSELQQVTLNLLNNAVDAVGGQGGTVIISTRRVDAGVVFEVADSGQGIPETILPRIFDPFFTTKAVGEGTGLGLSICYGLVKKLGGEIKVRSQVGRGAIFTISLPLAPENEPAAPTAATDRGRET